MSPNAVSESVTISDTLAKSSPLAAAKFIIPLIPSIICDEFQPAIPIYDIAPAASIAENFVFAPISLAFADSASSSPPVAPEIADTFAIPCSNCIPVFTTSLPKSTACLTPTNAPTATAAFDASDVSMLPALVDCEPKPFIPLVEPPRLLFKLLLALIADLILVKKLPFFNERVAPILFANIIYPPKSALYLFSSSSKAFSILALKKTFSVADALAILSQSNPFWT